MVYFELSTTKMYAKIEDTGDDGVLNELGESAETSMNNFLTSIVGSDDVPLEGAAITDVIKDAVNFAVVSRYKMINQDYEGAEKWGNQADKMRESIKRGLVEDADGYSVVLKSI